MKIAACADIHNGYSGRLDDTIWSMKSIYHKSIDLGCEKIFILGDLFHTRDSITQDVLCAVYDFFENHEEIEWIIFPGNHDQFHKTRLDINSVRVLSRHATITHKDSCFELDGRHFVILPFCHFEDEYMTKVKWANQEFGKDSVLLTHIGVNNATSNSCFLHRNSSIVQFGDTDFPLVLTGHYHNYQKIGNLYYTGSPIPFKFDEGMVDHGFLTVDTDSLDVEFINIMSEEGAPPDFVTITDETFEEYKISGELKKFKGDKVRISLDREYSDQEMVDIQNIAKDSGIISTHWMKKEIIPTEVTTIVNECKLGDSAFEVWLNSQKLNKKYDRSIMLDLHKQIAEEAEFKFASSILADAEI